MNKILSGIIISSLLSSSLFSEEIKIDDTYETFLTKTKKIELNENSYSEEVFFGEYSKWTGNSGFQEIMGRNLANGLGSGNPLGLGIGLIYGSIEASYKTATANSKYILIKDYTNEKGEKTRIISFICSKSFNDENVIKSFLNQQILKSIKGV